MRFLDRSQTWPISPAPVDRADSNHSSLSNRVNPAAPDALARYGFHAAGSTRAVGSLSSYFKNMRMFGWRLVGKCGI